MLFQLKQNQFHMNQLGSQVEFARYWADRLNLPCDYLHSSKFNADNRMWRQLENIAGQRFGCLVALEREVRPTLEDNHPSNMKPIPGRFKP